METQDQRILYSLAKTLEMIRIELNALRIVSQGIINAVSADPNNLPLLAVTLRTCIEADAATAIASPMTDQMIVARDEWIKRLLPPTLLSMVTQK